MKRGLHSINLGVEGQIPIWGHANEGPQSQRRHPEQELRDLAHHQVFQLPRKIG